jgi:GT2 family glycosyltransferase
VTLSIIILSWNTKELTQQCLKSIFDNVKDIDFEVIVVDNGSNDGSAEMIEKEFPQVILIKNKENLGFTKGNNQGFERSRGEYVLFLNSDTIIPSPDNGKSQFWKMVEAMRADKKIGILTPKLLNEDGTFQYELFRKYPNLAQTFWLYSAPQNRLTYKIPFLRKRYLTDINQNKSGYIDDYVVSGAAAMIPRKIYEKIGGRDEKIFYWMEDVDLCEVIKKTGYHLYYLAGASITHLCGRSNAMWDDLKKMLDFRTGYMYFYRKHRPHWQSVVVKWIFILNSLFWILPLYFVGLFIKKYRGKAKIFWQFARQFSKI